MSSAGPDVADALRTADISTTDAVERGVGVLLGADRGTSAAAVEALQRAERLGEGLALHAVILAARRGTDPAGAVAVLAEGQVLAAQSSEYERRVAREEAVEELRRGLVLPEPSRGVKTVTGQDAPADAVDAIRQGARGVSADAATWHLCDGAPLLQALVDQRWIEGLLRVAARAFVLLPTERGDVEALRRAVEEGSAPAGDPEADPATRSDPSVDGDGAAGRFVTNREPDYLDLLGLSS